MKTNPDGITNFKLTELANNNDSDIGNKNRCAHEYTKIYTGLFQLKRFNENKILEIGNFHENKCPGLMTLHEYFPNSEIHGIDIVDDHKNDFINENNRIIYHVCDNSNHNKMDELSNKLPEFDLIIDDGTHLTSHQQTSLGIMFKKLKSGGIYSIQSLHHQPTEEKYTKTIELLKSVKTGKLLSYDDINVKKMNIHI